MLAFLKNNKEKCTGCTACMASCPVNCISMIRDEEGFLYPTADEKCIHCGKCEKICPQNNKTIIFDQVEKKAYAALSFDKEIWYRSASGGAFSEICKVFENNDSNTIFVGAKWNGLKVEESCVEGYANILPLCKSKYIASDVNDTFRRIKMFLLKNQKVLFCGTPCQVAGLRNFLGREYDNLFLIDLICHGVGSPTVFLACISVMEEQIGKKIISYSFRSKGRKQNKKDETGVNKRIEIVNDPYIQLYLSQKCLRPSCGSNCKYRTEMRQGDMTIADFKGLESVFPNLIGTKKNYSTIVVNTQKGRTIMDTLEKSMIIHPCKIDSIKEHNPLFYRQTFFAEDRDVFFEEFIIDNVKTIKKYTKPATIKRKNFKRIIWDNMPHIIRRILIFCILGERSVESASCSNSMIIVKGIKYGK